MFSRSPKQGAPWLDPLFFFFFVEGELSRSGHGQSVVPAWRGEAVGVTEEPLPRRKRTYKAPLQLFERVAENVGITLHGTSNRETLNLARWILVLFTGGRGKRYRCLPKLFTLVHDHQGQGQPAHKLPDLCPYGVAAAAAALHRIPRTECTNSPPKPRNPRSRMQSRSTVFGAA